MRRRFDGTDLGLAAVLAVLVGWPAVALGLAAARSGSAGPAGRLFDQAMIGTSVRPLGLALETLRVVLGAELIAMPLGIVLAVLVFRTDLWGRGLIRCLLALVVFLPLPLHAAAWLGAFGNAARSQFLVDRAVLVGWSGAAFVHAVAALPWVVLIVGVALCRVERELEEAALLDAPAPRVVLGVSLRRSQGAIAAAALVVAVLTAGEMTVTDLLQVRTYAEEAYLQFQLGQGAAAAPGVALPPLVVLGGLLAIGMRRIARRECGRSLSRTTTARTWRLGPARPVVSGLVLLGAGALFLLPLAGLVWRAGRVAGNAVTGQAPRWSMVGLTGSLERAAVDLIAPSALLGGDSAHPLVRAAAGVLGSPLASTLLWAAVATVACVPLAWLLAWRSVGSRGWRIVLVAVASLLLATPGPVVGLALKTAWLHVPAVHDTPAIVVLAFVLRSLAYAALLLVPVLRAIPRVLIEAAAVEGNSRWGVIRRVAWPLSRRGTAGVAALVFVLASGELAASNLVLPPGVRTLAFETWSLLHTGTESHLAGVGLILVGLYGLGSLAAARLLALAVGAAGQAASQRS